MEARMKNISKLLLTSFICLGVTAFLTGCNSTSQTNEKGPSKILFTDDYGNGNLTFDLDIYSIDIEAGTTLGKVFNASDIKLSKNGSKSVSVNNKLNAYSCYQIVITPKNGSGVVYRSGSASYDFHYKNVFLASPGQNIKMKLEDFYNNSYYFKLSQI